MFRKIVLVGHLIGTIVQTNDCSMKVEIGVNSHRILDVLRQAKRLWEEHERSGKEVVQFAVSVPIFSKSEIFRAISRLGAVGMLHYSVEDMADDRSRAK